MMQAENRLPPRMAVMRSEQASAEPSECDTIEELFAALESALLAYALRLTGRLELAEDLVQEAFMRLHAQFDEVRDPKRWLYRIVHNLAVNHLREANKIVPLKPAWEEDASRETESADPQPLPDEQIVRLEGIGLVRLSLESLDERSRELIRLKFNEELSYKEIAALTGLNIGNVGYLLHHALKAIADELAKNGVVP